MPPKKAAKKSPKIPRQKQLTGMENAKIASIENLALDYVELRDERMAIGRNEVELKSKLIAAMHKVGKTEYRRGNITVKLKVEKEKITVRVSDDETEHVKATTQEESDPETAGPDDLIDAEVETEEQPGVEA